ncbi:beta-ketoacyl synthase [Streptomyces sp. ISL-11]|uniref:beta-ketoacyl-[acyl-carrier-protein] synthase family protein n=1 Tax=Streptomyces sp. ISL-11 TaxID=2819174 RepID=UPI001BEC45D8|nr:beta-ketoacyl-[acyl-carrier-protein] synthase family protein [Streptomyces sp. ISL-11]MBT2384968.1 beta-ketoacyl-[acyl-carrier-protein] synthase family protein [Streptomyces sp. ISL-11]
MTFDNQTPFHAAITGIGMVSAAGIGVTQAWERIRLGESTAADTVPELAGTRADFGCVVPRFNPAQLIGRRKAWRLDRSSQFALVAAAEALIDCGLDTTTWDAARVGVVLGCGIGGAATWEKQHHILLEDGFERVSPMLIPMLAVNMSAGYIAMETGARGPNFVVATACAAGTSAIGQARELLRNRVCDVVITGGTEACLIPSIVSGFSQMGALSRRRADPGAASRPFDTDRDGFVPAEGAAILILENVADAQARHTSVYARVSGYGASADAYHATAPDPEGFGAELAIRAALRDAGLSADDVTHVNAHGTSTPLNDLAEARVIRRVLGVKPAVTSVKGVIGHALGAAGAIEAAATALSIQHQQIPATANLETLDPAIELDVVTRAPRKAKIDVAISNSFGFGGQNAVLAFTAAGS